MKKTIKYLSLFSGIGAPEKALKNLNIDYELVGFSEIDKAAINSYCAVHNVPYEKNLGDITRIDISKLPKNIDLITHGSPCQDFSVGGYGKGGDEGSGTRSSLMWNSIEVIKHTKPNIIVWENVANVLSNEHKHNFDKYVNTLKELRYVNYAKVLNAKDYNIPQNRERLFCVSIKKSALLKKSIKDKICNPYEFKFPKPVELVVDKADLLEDNVDEKYYNDSKSAKREIEIFKQLRPTTNILNVNPSRSGVGGRVSTTNYVKTLTTNGCSYILVPCVRPTNYKKLVKERKTYISNKTYKFEEVKDKLRIRRLTPLECWRLMGFTDEDYNKATKVCRATDLYRQAGNSIVVNVIQAIFKELFKGLINNE